jgi:hypothetical protein
MNILLAQPDILKRMNDYYTNSKLILTLETSSKKIKMHYLPQLNEKQHKHHKSMVRNILENIKDPETNVLQNDLLSQDSTFKTRLEEKRRKKNSLFNPDNASIVTENVINIAQVSIESDAQLDTLKDLSEIVLDTDDKKNCKFFINLKLF